MSMKWVVKFDVYSDQFFVPRIREDDEGANSW
jgi:hypothetical protein